jgi:hypothetical protein
LAKRITTKKPEPIDYNYEIINLGDVHLRVVDRFYADSKQEADKTFDKWLEMKGLPNDTHNYGYRPRKQETVKDVEPNVAQNFQPTQQQTPDGVPIWEIYQTDNNHVVHRFDNLYQSSAETQAQGWLRDIGAENPGMYSVRPAVATTNENFADGKGPGRPGDSQRHGIPKGATIAQLEKAAKAPGRKGQLARWQLNMRRGKKK